MSQDCLGVLGNNLYFLLIIILRNSKNYDCCYGSKFPKDCSCNALPGVLAEEKLYSTPQDVFLDLFNRVI